MTTSFVDLTPQEWAAATDDELDIIIAGLEAELVAEKTDWRLNPRQQAAEDLCTNLDPTKAHEILYGGAAGGGKSQWMLWHLYHLALKYPGFRGLMIRRTFAQLTRTHIEMSFRRFDRSLCKFNQVSKRWKFNNGSTIEFGYLDKAYDVYNYDSAEYDTVCFDELTEWGDPENYLYLFSRIRTETHLVEQGLVGHMISATNPGRAGGAWVKARFIDFAEPMQRVDIQDPESNAITTRVFVPAKIDDNPKFGRRQYRAQLMNVDKKRRKQLEDGDWDAVEGQFFDEWDRTLHVRTAFEIPEYWTRVRAIDWGIHNPMCCLWAAFDGDGVCYIYRELYGPSMLNIIQARRILELTGSRETIAYTMADPSIWSNQGNGQNIAQQYATEGLRCRKAANARVDGWSQVRNYLRISEITGMPRLVIFDNCRNLIRTLPMLVHDATNGEDLDTEGEDHAADALRYLLMSRPRATRSPKREAASLDARHFEAIKRRRHERRQATNSHPELGRW